MKSSGLGICLGSHSAGIRAFASALAAGAVLLSVPASAKDQVNSTQGLPAAVARLEPVGRLPGTNRLALAIGLRLRNQEALRDLLGDIYNPASPSYRHYLTPVEFTTRFGPTEQDYNRVIAFARWHGLAVTGRHPNRMLLDVSGSVADIESALHVTLRTYPHPTEDRTFYAPDTEPFLDVALPILDIGGLDNYFRPRSHLKRSHWTSGRARPNAGSGPSGAYMGKDFRAAYYPGGTLTGAGQTVGLLEFDGYTASDISYYESNASLPSVTLTNVLLDGFSGAPTGDGGEVEVSLDIEMAVSMAPGLSEIIVYEAGPSGVWHDILNRMATDDLAQQMSCCWYIPSGPADPVADQIFQQMAAQGQSFYAASGDDDAYAGLIPFPGDTPYVTEVGGTTLTTSGPGGSWQAETVWNWGDGSGSGGGISTRYPIPSWQTNINMSANQGSTTMRNTPDLALTADNVDVRADGVDQAVGGTSCAAPLWAGFTALINQQAAMTDRPAVGFINPAIYALGAASNYTLLLHDITTGNNTNSTSPARFFAVPGYDLCTGWGTPGGQSLISALEPLVIVTLPATATEGDGLLAGAGDVLFPTAPTTNLTVSLASSDPTRVVVPESIMVPAGQTNTVFDLDLLDNGLVEGTEVVTITATVPGQGTASANITVYDKQPAVLSVSLPSTTTEGSTVQGTVQSSAPPAANVSISLSSSDTTELQVPASVILPLGQTSAVFTALAVTNDKLESPQTVTVTAHVQNWTDGVASLVVSNTNSWGLTLSLPYSAMENAGVLTNAAVVSLSGVMATDLAVSLVSSNVAKLIVPSTVTIPAGQQSAAFSLTLVESPVPDGHQTVFVTASAPNFPNSTAALFIIDNKSPPPPWSPRPANLAVNVPALTNLWWFIGATTNLILNGGFESGSLTNWVEVPSETGSFVINDGTYKPYSPDPPTPPFDGNYDAVGDEEGPGIFYMYQSVAIPPGVTFASLTWAQRVRNFFSSFSSSQEFQVRICDTNNNVLSTAFTTSPGETLLGDWTQQSYDLTTLAGQTVRIEFWVNSEDYYLEVYLDDVSLVTGTSSGLTTNNVYFGTDPNPGPEDFQGSTTNWTWTLPLLTPLTTYYWRIVAYNGADAGPIWQFTTAGVDHFAWSAITSPQLIYQPFEVAITAQDAFNSTVSNFNGSVSLAGTCSAGEATNEVIGDIPPARSSVGSYTFGYSFTPTNNITVTQVRSYFGTKVSIWTAVGTLVASQTVVSNSGSWQVTPLTTPVQLLAGNNYLVGAYTGGGEYYVDVTNSLPWVFPDGIVNVAEYAVGDTFPTYSTPSFGALVDLVYSVAHTSALAVSPTNNVSFTNGAWSGELAVPQLATNAILSAGDGVGHGGSSNPFNVDVSNDVSIAMVDVPHPVSVGMPLTYNLTIGNSGPTEATGVTVTNLLPGEVTFVSATCSQGTCAQSPGIVTGNLGVVPGGSNASLTIVVTPTVAETFLTNVAIVTRLEPDAYYGNNTATVITPVTPPIISIANSSVVQGSIGTTNMAFAVTLAVASRQTITVNYATANGTAVAGTNYLATNGVLSFSPGVTNQSIMVAVIGNTLIGSNKTFFVNLSNPVHGILGQATATATGTIIDLNGTPGVLHHFAWGAISSPQLPNQFFQVLLSAEDAFDNTVSNFTGNVVLTGAASISTTNRIMGSVIPTSSGEGLLTVGYTFTPSNNLTVTQFWHYFGSRISLWTAGGTLLATQSYVGTIHAWTSTSLSTPVQLSAGERYCLAAYASSSPPLGAYYWRTNPFVSFPNGTINQGVYGLGTAFPTNTRAAFWPLVDLGYTVGSTQSVVVTPGSSGPFANGGWSGNIIVGRMATNVVLSANDRAGHTGSSAPFNVSGARPGQLDHFAWNIVPSPQHATVPFATTISALDYFDNPATNFSGEVALSGASGTPPATLSISPINSGNFAAGAWNGNVTVLEFATNVTLDANDGNGHTGQSAAFNVSYAPPLAEPAAFTTPVNTPATFAAAKLALNDTAFDGGPLAVIAVSPSTAQGGAAALASGLVTYSPPTNYVGNDNFTYTISDAHADTAVGTVTATVGTGGVVSLNIVFGPLVERGNFVVRFAGVPGLTYTVEAASAITGPWTKVANLTAPTTDQGCGVGVSQYTEPVIGDSTRFYRTVYPPY